MAQVPAVDCLPPSLTFEHTQNLPGRNHVLSLMPKQGEFVNDDTHREILYSGAFGAGKTRALCVRAVRLAAFPGARVGLCRKTAADLKASTLITLLEQDGVLAPVLPPECYEHQRAAQRIKLHNGGEITYFGVDDPTKVASRPLTDVCLDEGIEVDLEEYEMLLGRIRVQYKRPDGTFNTNSICTATNPGSPAHFLYERFYEKPHPSRLLIETNTRENYYLADAYVESLNELSGHARERYYLGQWVAYEGQVYYMWRADRHIWDDCPTPDYYVAGMDAGFQNPNVIRLHACWYGTTASHVVWEFYESGVVSPTLVAKCQELAEKHDKRRITFVLDPSAADLAAQLRQVGINAQKPPERDVLMGIRCVQASLTKTVDDRQSPLYGRPLLTMAPICSKGNREYVAYRWKDDVAKEQPIKELDHAVDADRYARVYIAAGKGEPAKLLPLSRRTPARIEQPQRGAPETDSPWNPLDDRLWPGASYRR